MNKIVKQDDVYVMVCENGEEFQGKMHLEKGKTWLVRFPKNNPAGREFFTQSKIDADIENNGEFIFETKTEHRVGIAAGGWKSRLTEDEKVELAELEQRIEEIKQVAMSRQTPKLDKNSAEGIEAQIAKLQEKLAKMRTE